jgi:hypothetical protein
LLPISLIFFLFSLLYSSFPSFSFSLHIFFLLSLLHSPSLHFSFSLPHFPPLISTFLPTRACSLPLSLIFFFLTLPHFPPPARSPFFSLIFFFLSLLHFPRRSFSFSLSHFLPLFTPLLLLSFLFFLSLSLIFYSFPSLIFLPPLVIFLSPLIFLIFSLLHFPTPRSFSFYLPYFLLPISPSLPSPARSLPLSLISLPLFPP